MSFLYSSPKLHWNYFLSLEQDLVVITRFIEPHPDNNNTYSMELARLIMSATQEVDVVMKLICDILRPEAKAGKINEYYSIIKDRIPTLPGEAVILRGHSIITSPWLGWDSLNSPSWWKANNKIKHERATNFQQATLKNAIDSLSALLITVTYYYNLKSIDEIEDEVPGESSIVGLRHFRELLDSLRPRPQRLFFLVAGYYPPGFIA